MHRHHSLANYLFNHPGSKRHFRSTNKKYAIPTPQQASTSLQSLAKSFPKR